MYFFSCLHDILNNFNLARDKTWLVMIGGLTTTFVTVVLNIVFLLLFKMGQDGYLLSIIIGQMITCIVFIIFGSPFAGKAFPLSKNQKKDIIIYSIPLIFNGVAWWINQSLDKYFISTLLSVDDNGIYAVACKIPTILSTCLTIFMQAWNLSAIKEYMSCDSEEFYATTYKILRSFLAVVASVLIFCSIPIAKLMFAKDFFVAWKYSSVLLLSGIFSGMSSFLGSIFSAAKKSNLVAYSTVSAAALNICLNALLIPNFGIHGATVATAISFFVIWVLRFIFVQKIKRIKINIINEMIVYLLLILQIVLVQHESHYYLAQTLVFAALLIVIRKEIFRIINIGKSFLKRKN